MRLVQYDFFDILNKRLETFCCISSLFKAFWGFFMILSRRKAYFVHFVQTFEKTL